MEVTFVGGDLMVENLTTVCSRSHWKYLYFV